MLIQRLRRDAAALLIAAAAGAPLGAQPPARRQPVTPELARTAFADPRARTLLERAREARLARDSALRAYDAKSYLGITVGVGLKRFGRDRLLMRTEQASHVTWAANRDSGWSRRGDAPDFRWAMPNSTSPRRRRFHSSPDAKRSGFR